MQCLVCTATLKKISENRIVKKYHCPKCLRTFEVFKKRDSLKYLTR
jgi:transposase-like protein